LGLFLVRDDGVVDKDFLKDVIEFHIFTTIQAVKLAARMVTGREPAYLKAVVAEHGKCANGITKRAPVTLEISQLTVKAACVHEGVSYRLE
jgi:hypothetical protein